VDQNKSIQFSLKRNWMESVLGLNIPVENSIDALRDDGFKVSRFKFVLFAK
jgi:hypothetical protein